jgi:hypothetical protein
VSQKPAPGGSFTVGGIGNYAAPVNELDDAIAQLERAVARLDAAYNPQRQAAEQARVTAVAASVAERVDAALAKVGQLLEREN